MQNLWHSYLISNQRKMLQKLINNFILTFPKVVQNLLIKIAVVWQVELKNRTCKLALNRFYFLFEMISWFFTLIYFWNVFTLTKGPIFEGALGFEISGRDGHSRDLFKAGFNISFFFKNGPTPASFLFIFGPFKQTIQFLQQINVKKCHVHPVFGAGIWTHDLWNLSLLP